MWKKQVEEEIKKIRLRIEDAWDRGKWRDGVKGICDRVHKVNPATSVNGDKSGLKLT